MLGRKEGAFDRKDLSISVSNPVLSLLCWLSSAVVVFNVVWKSDFFFGREMLDVTLML